MSVCDSWSCEVTAHTWVVAVLEDWVPAARFLSISTTQISLESPFWDLRFRTSTVTPLAWDLGTVMVGRLETPSEAVFSGSTSGQSTGPWSFNTSLAVLGLCSTTGLGSLGPRSAHPSAVPLTSGYRLSPVCQLSSGCQLSSVCRLAPGL